MVSRLPPIDREEHSFGDATIWKTEIASFLEAVATAKPRWLPARTADWPWKRRCASRQD